MLGCAKKASMWGGHLSRNGNAKGSVCEDLVFWLEDSQSDEGMEGEKEGQSFRWKAI